MNDRDLACSPEGTSIALSVVLPHDLQGLWLMSVDGTRRARMRQSGVEPTFSPDGKRIAFVPTSQHRWGSATRIVDRRWLAAVELRAR